MSQNVPIHHTVFLPNLTHFILLPKYLEKRDTLATNILASAWHYLKQKLSKELFLETQYRLSRTWFTAFVWLWTTMPKPKIFLNSLSGNVSNMTIKRPIYCAKGALKLVQIGLGDIRETLHFAVAAMARQEMAEPFPETFHYTLFE